MYDLPDIMKALRAADAAGNKEDAQKLAVIANRLRGKRTQEEASGGGMMPFVNRGIAETVGAIPDLIRSGINFIPGVELPEAVGGRKSIESAMKWGGIRLPEEGQAANTIPEHMGQVVGQVAGLLNPTTAGVKGLARGANLTGKVASGVWQSMIKHPYLTMTSELTGAGAAGATRGVAQKEFPDRPGMQTGLEITAGMAGALTPGALVHTPTAIAIRTGKNVLHKVLLPFTKKGGSFRAGEFVKGLVPDAEGAARKVTESTISDLPPAIASGEKKIIATYKALVGQDPLADAETIEKLTGSIIKLEGEMRKMGYGSPELLEEITRKRVAAIELRMDKRVLDASTRAQKRLDSVPIANRKVAESRIVRNELEGAMNAERTEVNKAWEKVDKAIKVGSDKTRKTYKDLKDGLGQAQQVDIPVSLKTSTVIKGKKIKGKLEVIQAAAIKLKNGKIFKAPSHHLAVEEFDKVHAVKDWSKLVDDADGFVTNKGRFLTRNEAVKLTGKKTEDAADIVGNTLKQETRDFKTTLLEMQSLRSKLLETARIARKEGQWNKARIAQDVSDAIIDDLDNAATPEFANLKAAIAATKQFKMRFESGDVGKILGYSRSGAPAMSPDLTLEMTIGRMGDRGAVDINKIVVTPEARSATQRYLARSFTDYADPTGSGISQAKADRWVRTNEAILDEFPGLKKQLSKAISAQEFADNTKLRMQARKESLQNPRISEAARFLNRADMGQEISGILKARRPTRTAMELVRQARKDPSGNALEGLRAGFIDDMLGKSTLGPFNDLGEQTLSGRALLSYINKNEPTLRAVFDNMQISRMKRVGSELSKIETFDKIRAGKTGIELKDRASSSIRMMARLTGAKLGGKIGSSSMGGSLQYASIFSSRAQKFITWLSKDTAEQLVNDAILSKDPALLNSLLKPMAKPTPKRKDLVSLNKNLNLWLLTTGKRVFENVIREEEK